MGPKRLVLTLAIRDMCLYFVQLRIAKVKTSLLGPIDSTLCSYHFAIITVKMQAKSTK